MFLTQVCKIGQNKETSNISPMNDADMLIHSVTIVSPSFDLQL